MILGGTGQQLPQTCIVITTENIGKFAGEQL